MDTVDLFAAPEPHTMSATLSLLLLMSAARANPAAAAPDASPESAAPAPAPVPIGVDLWPGVGTSSVGRGQDRRVLSTGLVCWAGSVEGAEACALGGLLTEGVDGVQAGGLFAMSGGPVSGAQLGGAFTRSGGDVEGAAGSGAVSLVAGAVDGALGAGAAALAEGPVRGVVAAGLLTRAEGVEGVQAAGLINLSAGSVDGAQLSGGLNWVEGDVRGLQAGLVNINSGDVDGVMFGLVNVAENADAAIGLINVLRDGRKLWELSLTEEGLGRVIRKAGGRKVHTLWAAGVDPSQAAASWSLGLGIGVHHGKEDARLWVDTDLLAEHRSPINGLRLDADELLSARAQVGLQVAGPLSVVAGPAWNLRWTEGRTAGGPPARWPALNADMGRHTVRQWPGVHVGLTVQ